MAQQLFDIAAYVRGEVQTWDMWAENLGEAKRIATRELKRFADLGGYIISVKPHTDEPQ